MRATVPPKLEAGRIRSGPFGSDASDGLCGAFELRAPSGAALRIISSGSFTDELTLGWEHVSVSTAHRVPNWQEMCWVKNLFWDEEECVVQFHPPLSKYVNIHPHTLHLWRHKTQAFLIPPIWQV